MKISSPQMLLFNIWSLGVTTDPGEKQSFVSIFVLNVVQSRKIICIKELLYCL